MHSPRQTGEVSRPSWVLRLAPFCRSSRMHAGTGRSTRFLFRQEQSSEVLSAVLIAIVIPVVITVSVPAMVVPDLAAIAIPVALIVAVSIMTRFHPACARVHWPGPVSVVPLIVVAHRVPVAAYPGIIGAGAPWLNPNYT